MTEPKEVIGGVIANKDIKIDGTTYTDVTFKNCRMIFDGNVTSNVGFDRCAFHDCTWHFEGPAGNTLLFVNNLASAMGPEGKRLIKNIFKNAF